MDRPSVKTAKRRSLWAILSTLSYKADNTSVSVSVRRLARDQRRTA